jgi:hypothetical protein
LFNYLGNISYEKQLNIDNKLHNYLKITGILNYVFRPQKNLKKTRIKIHWPSQFCCKVAKLGLPKQGTPEE